MDPEKGSENSLIKRMRRTFFLPYSQVLPGGHKALPYSKAQGFALFFVFSSTQDSLRHGARVRSSRIPSLKEGGSLSGRTVGTPSHEEQKNRSPFGERFFMFRSSIT